MRRRRGALHPPLIRNATPRETRVMAERKLDAEREMWAYDQMPPALRRAIAGSATRLHTSALLADYEDLPRRTRFTRAQVAQVMVENMADLEEQMIREFARKFEARHGWPYPHAAAQASVLRPRNHEDPLR